MYGYLSSAVKLQIRLRPLVLFPATIVNSLYDKYNNDLISYVGGFIYRHQRAVGNKKHFTITFKNELTSCLQVKRFQIHLIVRSHEMRKR